MNILDHFSNSASPKPIVNSLLMAKLLIALVFFFGIFVAALILIHF